MTSSLNTTNTELGTVRTSAANAMTKAQTAVDANSALSTRVDSLYAAITESEGTTVDVTAFNALKSEVNTINGTVNTLVSDTTALKSNYTNLSDQVSANTAATSSLTTRMVAAEGSISAHNSDITLLRSDVNTFSDNLATKASNEAVSALTSDLSIAKGNITNQASDITRLKTSLNSNSSLSLVSGTSDSIAGVTASQSNKLSLVADTSTQSGSYIKVGANSGNDYVSMLSNHFVNIDPNKLYRVRYRYRRTQGSSSIYLGLMCANASKSSGITATNTTVANDVVTSALFFVTNFKPTSTDWQVGEAYFKDRSTGSSSGSGTKASPRTFPASAAYARISALVGYSSGAGEFDIDYITFEDAEHVAMNDVTASAVQSLTATVSDHGGVLSSHTNSLTSLNGSIQTLTNGLATKADSSALNNYYTKTENNSAIAGQISSFSAKLTNVAGKNLFDFEAWNTTDKQLTSNVPYAPVQLLPNTQYTISTNITKNPNGYDAFAVMPGSAASSAFNGFGINEPLTFTTDDTGVINIAMRSNTLNASYAKWIQIELGSVATSFVPHVNNVKSAVDLVTTANATAIQTTQADVATVDGKTTANSNAITTLQGKMSVVEGGLETKADSSALQALDNRVTTAEGAVTSQSSSITSLNNSLTTTNSNVTAAQNAANAANTLAGGKGKVLFQSTAPAVADHLAQNLWIDTTGNVNAPKRWNGTAWVVVTDKVATDALAAANAANTAITTKADASALSDLDSKVAVIAGKVTSQASSITKLQSDLTATDTKAGTALTNAATAQTTANTAVTDAAANANNISSLQASLKSVSTDGANLIPNGSFEDDLVLPPAVKMIRHTGTNVGYGNTSACYKSQTGSSYAELKFNEILGFIGPRVFYLEFATKITALHTQSTSATLQIAYAVGSNAYSAYPGVSRQMGNVPVDSEWVIVSGKVAIPDTASKILIRFVGGNNTTTGEYLVDAFKCIDITEAYNAQKSSDANASAISTTNVKVENIDGKLTTAANDITSLKGSVQQINGTLSTKANASALTDLTTRVSNAEDVNTSQGSSITNLQNNLATTNTNVSKKADSSAVTTLNNKVTAVDGRVTTTANDLTSLQGRVNTVENGLTTKANASALNDYYTKVQANDAIAGQITSFNANLEIGGVNLAIGTENPVTTSTVKSSNATGALYGLVRPINDLYAESVSKKCVMSFDWEYVGSTPGGTFYLQGQSSPWTNLSGSAIAVSSANLKGRVEHAFVMASSLASAAAGWLIGICRDNMEGAIKISNLKFEFGTKATTWSPSPQDVKTALDANVTAINSTNTNVSNLNGTVTSQGTRISSMENKVNSSSNGLDTKVSQTTFDTLNNKVTNTDTGLEAVNSKTTVLTTNVSLLNKTKNYIVSNYRNGSTLSGFKSRGVHDGEKLVVAHNRGLNLTLINADGTIGSNTTFDTYAGFAAAVLALRTALEALTTTQFFILTGQDHIGTFGTSTDANAVACRDLLVNCGVPTTLLPKLVNYTLPVIVGRKTLAQGAALIQVLETTVSNQWMDTPLTFVDGRPVGVGGSSGDKFELDVTTKALEDLSSVVNHSTTGLTVTNSKVVSLEATVNSTVNGLPSKVSTTAFDTLANKVNSSTTGIDALNSKTTLLSTDLSNLTIGGENIINGSSFKGNSRATGEIYKNANVIRAAFPSSGYVDMVSTTTAIEVEGEYVTYSFDAKASVDGTKILTYVYNPSTTISGESSQGVKTTASNGEMTFTLSTSWTRYWVIYKLTKDNVKRGVVFGRLRNGTAGVTVDIARPKVELGTKATDWSESTGDIQNALSANVSAVESLTTRLNTEAGKITANSNKIVTLESKVNDPTTGVSALSTGLNNLKTTVENSSTGVVATSQQLTALTSKVDAIKIGGVNTYSNVDTTFLTSNSHLADKNSLAVPNGFQLGTASASPRYFRLRNVIKSNGWWTISGYAKGNQSQTNATFAVDICDIQASGGSVTLPLDDSWIYFSYSVNVTNYTADVYNFVDIQLGGFLNYMFKNIKVEEGNKATAWTPHPDDLQKVIDAKASAEAFDSLKTYVGNDSLGGATSLASKVTALTSTVGNNTNALTVQANVLDGVKAQYHVKMETNGVIGGFGLLQSTGQMGTVTTTFGVNSDRFFIGAPANGKKPFIVTTASQTINGMTYPAGTWIDVALIANATIGTAHIADAAITSAKIGNAQINNAHIVNLNAGKIDAGYLSAERIEAKSIEAGKLNVTELSAISANLGTFTSSVANKGTTVISGPLIDIKYTNGVSAVKIGVW